MSGRLWARHEEVRLVAPGRPRRHPVKVAAPNPHPRGRRGQRIHSGCSKRKQRRRKTSGGVPRHFLRTPSGSRGKKTESKTESGRPELARSVSAPSKTEDEELSLKEYQDGVKSAITELNASHDVEEAVTRVQNLKIPPRHQKAVVGSIFAVISEQGDAARLCGLNFILQLVGVQEPRKEVLQRVALLEGLEEFFDDRYVDLKCDVPKLPTILREEFLPALGKEALTANEIAALILRIDAASDS